MQSSLPAAWRIFEPAFSFLIVPPGFLGGEHSKGGAQEKRTFWHR
jgi:hypothetical protein